tara:strand:- start:232 stop:1161 length:930 start_codon:yes stop_codon:yes gene_type:complete
MSKIKVNELEAKDTNTNVKLTANGTGVLKVKGAGGNDGTVKVTSSNGTTGVKLKSPTHTAGQSYTLTLPDNNIEAGKYLKVKSISGSGATASGQLECADIATPDLTNLNASNLTSGTIASARLPSSFSGAQGASLELISKTTVTSYNDNVSNIQIYLDDDSMYKVVIKKISEANNASASNLVAGPYFRITNSSGGIIGMSTFYYYKNQISSKLYSNGNYGNTSSIQLNGGADSNHWAGVMDITTKVDTNLIHINGMAAGSYETSFNGFVSSWMNATAGTSNAIRGINFIPFNSTYFDDVEILLYKLAES